MANAAGSRAVRRRRPDPLADDLRPPLVEAKLAAPRLRVDILPRPRLARALEAGDDAALTLVSAPPGYGKTTAIRAWCHARRTPAAWVTLDGSDNDPIRLWTYLATAVDRVRDGLGRRALQRLRMPGVAIESVVDELTNGIRAYDGGLVIVADDVHSVTDEACLATVDRFAAQLPANARLVLVARSDPALRLARLRANGELTEVRARELAFTSTEAHQLLVERGGLDLAPNELELVVRRTEGWPAALVLAGLWLRAVPDPRRAVREFGGDQQFVAEYLSQEVLGALDQTVRSFLVRASVLGRFTAELCDGVLARSDSATIVAELERSNLLVIPLEHGGWFRIHALLAEFARLELASTEPRAELDIHRRAAAWLCENGLVVEAAEHAAAAGEQDLVAKLLSEHHRVLVGSGRERTLLRRTLTLPDEQLLDYPDLTVAAANAAAMVGHSMLEQRRLLRLASRAEIERPERCGPYAEALAAMVRAATADGGVSTAVDEGARAVAVAEAAVDELVVAALAAYSRALYFAGELDQAWASGLRAAEHTRAERRPTDYAFARTTLALVAAELGRLASARAHAEKAKAMVGQAGGGRTWLGANAAAALGVVLAAEGDLPRAERELAYAERFFRDELATVHHAWLLLLLGRTRCCRGRLDEAQAALDHACEEIAELGDTGSLSSLAEEVEGELEDAKVRVATGELVARPTGAELAVLELLATDLPVREIAEKLFLSPNTVRSHSRTIYRKLGVSSRADAVARAEVLHLFEESGVT